MLFICIKLFVISDIRVKSCLKEVGFRARNSSPMRGLFFITDNLNWRNGLKLLCFYLLKLSVDRNRPFGDNMIESFEYAVMGRKPENKEV